MYILLKSYFVTVTTGSEFKIGRLLTHNYRYFPGVTSSNLHHNLANKIIDIIIYGSIMQLIFLSILLSDAGIIESRYFSKQRQKKYSNTPDIHRRTNLTEEEHKSCELILRELHTVSPAMVVETSLDTTGE